MAEAVRISGYTYAGDENGAPVKLKTNGWSKVAGKWFYCIGGQYLFNTIFEIDGNYYGFDLEGRMYDDQEFYINSQAFRAKKGGSLYRKEWYKEKRFDVVSGYYYGTDCAALVGYSKVDGKYYYFNSTGLSAADTLVRDDKTGRLYAADKKGIVKPVTITTGWVETGKGTWYYLLDGEAVTDQVVKIKTKYYGFDKNGVMYSNEAFVSDSGSGSKHFRAKADGSLYRNEWIYPSDLANGSYYGANGEAVTGLQEIDGKLYYFDKYGDLNRRISQLTLDGTNYIVDVAVTGECFRLSEDGFFTVGEKKYYIQNGSPVKSQVSKIGSQYYYFRSDGVMSTGRLEYYNGGYYRTKWNGELYRNEWYADEYYDADGRRYSSGFYTIGSSRYYFMSGKCLSSTYVMWDGTLFWLSSKGVASEVKKDGLYYLSDGRAVMISGGMFVKGKWEKIDDSYIYFYNSKYAADGSYETGSKSYIARVDGVMLKNGWIRTKEGTYYAGADGALLTGTQTIDGKEYMFSSSGYMHTGFLWDGSKIWYYGSDGVKAKEAFKEGWNKFSGKWYYVNEGDHEPIMSGEFLIDGHYYYFKDYVMQANFISNTSPRRIYDKNGHRVEEGWYKLAGAWYYVTNGYCCTGNCVSIEGKEYSFYSDGRLRSETYTMFGNTFVLDADGSVREVLSPTEQWMVVGPDSADQTGGYFYYPSENKRNFSGWVGDYYIISSYMKRNYLTSDGYLLGRDGKWIKKQGFHKIYPRELYYENKSRGEDSMTDENLSRLFYVKSNGKAARDEWQKVDGKWYFFNSEGWMLQGPTIYKGKLYLMDSKGAWIRTVEKPDGWYEYRNSWVYVRNGEIIKNNVLRIQGTLYNFDKNGIMQKNVVGSSDGSDKCAYFGKNGAEVKNLTGWQKIGGKYYYFLKDGSVVSGWVHVGKQNYYIDPLQGMLTGIHVVDGQICTFNSNGALVSQVKKINGWYEGSDGWYYYQSGKLITDSELWIDGKHYYFENGKMVANRLYMEQYIDRNGQAVRNSWKTIGKHKYYFGGSGIMYTGFQMIDGQVYLFDERGKLIK